MLHMLQKCSILHVAGVFFNEPTKDHYLMEVSKEANLAHTAVKKHLLELKKMLIITEHSEKKGKRTFPIYKANINHKEYRKHKIIYNLIKLQESNLIVFLKDNLMPTSIVLFGSFQKGEDIESSDIDLYLECKKEDLKLEKFKKQLHRNIQLHFKESFNNYPPELKNNIINGLVLEGYLEVF